MSDITDPVEKAFADMCREFGIKAVKQDEGLDFLLPEFDLQVELKAWPTERIHEQLERAEAGKRAVMVLVGVPSVRALAFMLAQMKRITRYRTGSFE